METQINKDAIIVIVKKMKILINNLIYAINVFKIIKVFFNNISKLIFLIKDEIP